MIFFWPAALCLKTTKFVNKSSNFFNFHSQYQIHLMFSHKILPLLKHRLCFETSIRNKTSAVRFVTCEHFEHIDEAKNHTEALHIFFDSAKYGRHSLLDAFRKRFSAFRQRTNFSCSAIIWNQSCDCSKFVTNGAR